MRKKFLLTSLFAMVFAVSAHAQTIVFENVPNDIENQVTIKISAEETKDTISTLQFWVEFENLVLKDVTWLCEDKDSIYLYSQVSDSIKFGVINGNGNLDLQKNGDICVLTFDETHENGTVTFTNVPTITGSYIKYKTFSKDRIYFDRGRVITTKTSLPSLEIEDFEDEIFEELNHEIFENLTDISIYDSHYDGVKYAVTNDWFAGITEDTFAPNSYMNRAMLWTVLYRHYGGVADTTGENWYSNAQKWVTITHVSDGMHPMYDLTLEEVITILYRYIGSPTVGNPRLTRYSDGKDVSTWAENAMNWAINNQIIEADLNNNLNPRAYATRAEVATILMNIYA